ncbi:hypothetical protein ASPSYDRAFT_32791 [Aspergillus sydowii CBS 593.65]|uniref:TPR domain protein n=1 Tax=Aspergillus sydowii CBS 593.65 TaxID=1036612 RepID=A0A1L9TEB9_9EURO|nr:uncharacterized protein ASPSYDRAFT_32791 [Aspergillus sydowii CBS 593.65]OJJ57653.1 hypothetical protein ASPSYDRAFT_32791 [Aspergillus sydowii CBS 593.65]
MLSAAAARRTGSAFIRTPTTSVSSRTIAFATRPRPLQHLPKSNASVTYKQLQSLPSPLSRHVLNLSHQTRSLSYLQRTRLGLRQASKGIWRKNPVLLPFAIVSVIGATLFFAYIAYIEVTQNAPQYHKFPPTVANELRKAVYYTDVILDPQQALKYYKSALKAALEVGMHPYSDEVVGIKLQVAKMLEQAGMAKPAIDLLERTKTELLDWVDAGRKAAAEKKENEEKHKKTAEESAKAKLDKSKTENAVQTKLEINNQQIIETYEEMKRREEYDEQQRDKAMKKAVGICIKIADLYDSDFIQDPKKAQAAQESAVELSLKELAYRQGSGLPVNGSAGGDDEKIAWLTRTDVVIALVELAQTYFASDNKADLSIPLFLRALEILRQEEGPKPTCRQVMLIGDVAAAMGGRAQLPFRVEDPEAARAQTIDNARQWAAKALEINERIPEAEKDEGCYVSCVHVKYTLGEFAEQQGKLKEARNWYRQALDGAKDYAQRAADDPESGDLVALLETSLARVSKK